MRCPLCDARKARRACPALQQEICAVCCGTKRLTEIRCPADCGYLQSARHHPPATVRRRDEREITFFAAALHGTTERQRAIVALVQSVILQHVPNAVPRVLDRDVADAAAALASTFETAARGIIYEQQAASLPAQRLAADLRQQIEQALHTSERPLDRDVASALRVVETLAKHAGHELGDVSATEGADAGGAAYLEFLSRRFSQALNKAQESGPEDRGRDRPRLIVPGA
jgi:hypothetical protein